MTDPIRVLLVEDNPWDARLITAMFDRASRSSAPGSRGFTLSMADSVAAAVAQLRDGAFDIILLDLNLPDSEGIGTLARIREAVPHLPIVVQTALDDESTGIMAMQCGAQDYLIKGRIVVDSMCRTLRHAIERHRLQMVVQQLSLTDDLTGLHNRRGFHALAEQHLKVARRGTTASTLLVGDLDGFKQINDTFGHQQGDQALVIVADALRATFRDSDILARAGGDEFVVLAIGSDAGATRALLARLDERLESASARLGVPFTLAMSIGVAEVAPQTEHTLDGLLALADAAMYEVKRERKARVGESR